MHWQARLTKYWAYLSMGLVTAIILFLFGYVFYRGADTISWEFLTQAPSGAVLAESGRRLWEAFVLPQLPLYLAVFRQLQPLCIWCSTVKNAG